MGRKKVLNLSIGAAALGACIAGIGSSGSVHAASYSAQYVGASVGGNYVRVSTTGDVQIEVIPSSTGSMAVGKSLVNVETNADTGYRLYASGYNSEPDGYTALYYNGSPTNSDKLLSIHTTTPASFTTPNQWGFATVGEGYAEQSKYESAIGSGSIMDETTISSLKWKGIKSDYQLLTNTSTANTGNPHQVPVYYGVYANNDAALGDYRNIVVYTAFTESSNTIVVQPSTIDDGDTITITTGFQNSDNTSISADHIELTLYDSSNPSANIGTCDNIVVDSANNGSNGNPLKFTCTYHKGTNAESGKRYSVQLRIAPLDNGIYISYGNKDNAWEYSQKVYFQTIGSTQADANDWCYSLTEWTQQNKIEYTLYDTRDSKSYLVRKLADGNCWMVQNLALEGSKTLKPADSNVTSNYPMPSSNRGPSGQWSSDTSQYMWNGTEHQDATKNNALSSNNDTSTKNLGAYYSFLAATAGTGTGSTKGETASSSICPKWWHLPTSGDDSKEFPKLYKAYSSTTSTFNEAFNVAFTGLCNSSSCPNALGYANYWSASINSGTYGYYLVTDSSSTNPSSYDIKRLGRSVRCMLTGAQKMQDGAYMQEVNSDSCAATTTWTPENPVEYTLKDKRDEKAYLVRKLADGNCWMVQNLALDSGETEETRRTITSADSDVSSDFTLPISNTIGGWANDSWPFMWNGNHEDAKQDTAVTSSGTGTSNTGAYYSFLTATAGTGTGGTNGETASGSICPKWWHLPTSGNNTKEFGKLYTAYSFNTSTFNEAFNIAFTGYCYTHMCPDQYAGIPYSQYWSASIYDNRSGYSLYTAGGSTSYSEHPSKGLGYSVRCMLSGN